MLIKNSFFLRHKKLIILSAVVLVLVIAGVLGFSNIHTHNTTFASTREPYTVSKGNISSSITGSGVIQSSITKKVASEVSANVLKVNVAVGDTVSKGDVLFELDTTNLNTQIRAEQKNISNSSKSVNSYKEDIANLKIYSCASGYISDLNYSIGDNINKNSVVFKITNDDYYYLNCSFYYNSNVDIKVGDTATVFASSSLINFTGEVSFVSTYKTISSEGLPLQSVEIKIPNPGYTIAGLSANATVHTSTIDIKSADFAKIQEADPVQIKALSSGTIASLNAKNGDFVNAGDLVISLSNDDLYEELSNAQSNLSDAYEDLNNVKDNLDFYTITAPIDGVITSLDILEGDYVRAETNLCTIVNNDNLEFDINVDELDILDVKLGQEVKIEIDALSDTKIKPIIGYVSEIALEGTTSNSVTTYPVTISLSGDSNIKIGFNCSAEILTSNVEDVLVAPVDAIESVKGKYYVTLEDYTRKEVAVGTYNEDYIEITSGLDEGDVILLPEKKVSSSNSNEKENQKDSFNFSNMSGGMPMNIGGSQSNSGGNRGGNMPMNGEILIYRKD